MTDHLNIIYSWLGSPGWYSSSWVILCSSESVSQGRDYIDLPPETTVHPNYLPGFSPHEFDITHFAHSSSGSSLSLPHLLGTRHSGSGHSYPYGSQLKPRKNEVSISSTLGSYGCYFPVGITLRSSYLALLCQHPGTHLSSSSSEASPDCQWWDRGRRVYRNSWCAGSTSPQSGDFPAAMPLLPVSPSNSCHPEPWLLPEQSNERSDMVTRALQRALFSAGSCW